MPFLDVNYDEWTSGKLEASFGGKSHMKCTWFFSIALSALLIALLASCDKNPSGDAKEKVWTSEDCKDLVHDPSVGSFDECDSIRYREFIEDCEWDGDSIPERFRTWDDVAKNRGISLYPLRKLSNKFNTVWWWNMITISGSLDTIPSFIWERPGLGRLLFIDLPNVKSIPELHTSLPKLQILVLREMPLVESLPKNIWLAPSLNSLDINNLGITEIPTWIDSLVWLNYLRVSETKIQAIPDGVMRLAHLQTLFLNDNQISSLPSNFCSRSVKGSIAGNRLCNLSDAELSCLGWDEHQDSTQICN